MIKVDELLSEAVVFFRNEKGFQRLMQGFIKNYRRLGRIGGTVKLTKLTSQEKEALSGIMGKDYSRQDSATISLADFQKALDRTKFNDLYLKDLLMAYSRGNLLTQAQEEEIYRQEKEAYFAELSKKHQGENSQVILEHIRKKGSGTRGIHQAYDQDSILLKGWLNNVLEAVEVLPKGFERLPVFANRVTKNPHGFAINSEKGRLLIFALQIIRVHRDSSFKIISSPTAEEITEILGNFNIIRDDLLNFVTCAGLLALREKGQIIPMWQEALQERAVMNVPLREITRIESFLPGPGAAAKEEAVFVVENSGVFSEIIDCFADKKLPPLICTHGQFKLAALLLMDKLVNNGIVLYYSGDFDPEGLQMAQRLLKRFPKSLKLWHYTVSDYEDCLSEVTLSQSRLNKLASITTPALMAVKDRILSSGKAGYQEQLVPLLVKGIELIFK